MARRSHAVIKPKGTPKYGNQATKQDLTLPARPLPPTPVSDPRDASYNSQVAKLLFQRNARINGLIEQDANDSNDVKLALQRLAQARPDIEGNIQSNANRQGLLYSTNLANQNDRSRTEYAQQQGDATRQLAQRHAARVRDWQDADQQLPLDTSSAYAEAVVRQQQRDQDAADAGTLPTNLPTTTFTKLNPGPKKTKIKYGNQITPQTLGKKGVTYKPLGGL